MEVDEAIPPTQILDTEGRSQSQVINSAGGFVWKVDDMTRLRRFLVLGSESPTYYIEDRQLEQENARSILHLLQAGRGVEVVNEILKYSVEGRTVKQNAIMFALATCARHEDLETKRRAYEVVPQVCRIPTHLFMFVDLCKKRSPNSSGWGRAHRKAIRKWYTSKEPMKLAQEITKYQKREGWSHRDVARLMHLKPDGTDVCDELAAIMKYVVRGWEEVMRHYFPAEGERPLIDQGTNKVLEFLKAVEDVKRMTPEDESDVVNLIREYRLVREHIPTPCLNQVEVWRALAENMPMAALIRNLGKMTSIQLFNYANVTQDVCSKLRNETILKKARIHPFNVLTALKIYLDGHGDKGRLRWEPNESIAESLEAAFYLSFKNVSPTNKRYLLALDVSGSMSYVGCAGTPCITPRVASAAMSMVTARTESDHHFVAFSHKIVPLIIDQKMTLDEVLQLMEMVKMGGTDCAQPMLYAIEKNLPVDVFVVYTDSETKAGIMHPCEALKRYREHSKITNAKLIVVAMTSNGFTIADPDDPGMFDMVGFDSAAPQVMREFILGNI